MPLPLLMPVLPMKYGSLNLFPETPRETIEEHWHYYMTDATDPVGISQVFLRPLMETLFKDFF